jgi:trigger factor
LINEHKHPELNDEFAAKVGPFTSVKELKDDIKRELLDQKNKDSLEKFKDDLLTELISLSKVPVPEILIADQSKSIEQDFQSNLMYQGLTIDQYLETQKFKNKEEWLTKEVKPAAIKRVQAGLILAELSKLEKIQASADELAENINRYREQYASRPEIVKQFETIEAQRDLANRLITEKTIDRLVELNSNK